MSFNVRLEMDHVGSENKVNLEYAGRILTKLLENEDFRDIKLVASLDQQKYLCFLLAHIFVRIIGPFVYFYLQIFCSSCDNDDIEQIFPSIAGTKFQRRP